MQSSALMQLIRQAPRTIVTAQRSISSTPIVRDSFQIQDSKDFEERVIKSKLPVIVDFYANWCNPCRVLAPRIEGLTMENNGKIHLAKVNIDENSDLALDYEVSTIPVLMAVRNGQVEGRLSGLQDTDKLRKWIDGILERDLKEKAVKN